MYKIYFGHDCDSINGFNHGYYLPETFEKLSEAEKYAEEFIENIKGCGDVIKDESSEYLQCEKITAFFNPETGEEITPEEYEKNPEDNMYRYVYVSVQNFEGD